MTKNDLSKIKAALMNLISAREKMGAELSPIEFDHRHRKFTERTIESNNIDDVEEIGGVLTYKGQQITLHIVNPRKTDDEIPDEGPRFHISFCKTLSYMKDNNRYERYGFSDRNDGQFEVRPMNYTTRKHEAEILTPLFVCKNCLEKLNYENYRYAKSQNIVNSFSLKKFFDECHSFFRQLPTQSAKGFEDGNYPNNWIEKSKKFRTQNGWICDCCKIDLSNNRKLLHVHHINGNKGNCNVSNLRCLCMLCHAKQPMHGHMKPRIDEIEDVLKIRTDHGLPDICPECNG